MTTALITGASAGLGTAFARQLAGQGHDLVLVARRADRLEALAAELRAAHHVHVEVLPADLADRADLERVAARVRQDDRPVEILVNNAGLGQPEGFVDNDIAAEENALDVMVRAVLVLSHAAARAMRARGRGAILNVASVAAWITMGTYSAAKAWVVTFSEGLAGELAGSGVTVTAVCPGMTRTEFHAQADMEVALPRIAWSSAESVVDVALASARRGEVIAVADTRWKPLAVAIRLMPRPLIRTLSNITARTGLSGAHG